VSVNPFPACPARIPAIRRTSEPAEPLAEDAQRLGAVLVDVDSERPRGGDRRLGVRRAPEAGDPGLAFADRAEQDGPVRDRLVPGHLEVPDQPRYRLDEERGRAHSSITGAETTP
jgi:hypothetical protein